MDPAAPASGLESQPWDPAEAQGRLLWEDWGWRGTSLTPGTASRWLASRHRGFPDPGVESACSLTLSHLPRLLSAPLHPTWSGGWRRVPELRSVGRERRAPLPLSAVCPCPHGATPEISDPLLPVEKLRRAAVGSLGPGPTASGPRIPATFKVLAGLHGPSEAQGHRAVAPGVHRRPWRGRNAAASDPECPWAGSPPRPRSGCGCHSWTPPHHPAASVVIWVRRGREPTGCFSQLHSDCPWRTRVVPPGCAQVHHQPLQLGDRAGPGTAGDGALPGRILEGEFLSPGASVGAQQTLPRH